MRRESIFKCVPISLAIFFVFSTSKVYAAGSESHGSSIAITLLWIAVILILAKLSSLVEKFGQPAVLGELIVGIILGNLAFFGSNVADIILHDPIITFLAELGVIILLFQIGLESEIKQMLQVGVRSLMVAIAGVLVPFMLGYMVGPFLLPGLSQNTYLFLGAALTATSVGITARVFKDLKKIKLKEAQIVLGAAVIDDVLGLIILAVVSALVEFGNVSMASVSLIAGKAFIFLIGSIVIGQYLAPIIGKYFSKIHTGIGMKFTFALSICLFFAYLADLIGLAAIIGAFAAGLVLDAVHFRDFLDPTIVPDLKKAIKGSSSKIKKKVRRVLTIHSDRHIEDLVDPLSHFLVPIFFVYTGMQVRLETLFDFNIVLMALLISAIAIAGKYVAGLFAGKGMRKSLVGMGMVPRGEVGLIFANIGKGIGIISDEVFSIIVIMVVITTLITPPVLSKLLKNNVSSR